MVVGRITLQTAGWGLLIRAPCGRDSVCWAGSYVVIRAQKLLLP